MPGAPNFDLTYQDYIAANPQNNGGSEGGQGTFSGLSEDQWNALSQQERWNNLGGGVTLAPGDARYDALAGQIPGGAPTGNISVFSGAPSDTSVFSNPSNVYQGGGFYATDSRNFTPAYQARANQGGLSDRAWAFAPVAILAAPAIAAAAGAAGAGAEGAASAGETGAFDVGGSTGFGGSTALDAGAEAGAGAGAGSGSVLTPDEAAAIPNVDVPMQPPPEVSVPPPEIPGGGIIDGARGAVSGAMDWYNGLSPASRLLIGTALSQGAGAVVRGVAQQQALRQQQNIINQQRQDYQRRHAISGFTGDPFTPKGVIDNARTGG